MLFEFLAEYGLEMFMKMLTRRTDVEDALLRLDSLIRKCIYDRG